MATRIKAHRGRQSGGVDEITPELLMHRIERIDKRVAFLSNLPIILGQACGLRCFPVSDDLGELHFRRFGFRCFLYGICAGLANTLKTLVLLAVRHGFEP